MHNRKWSVACIVLVFSGVLAGLAGASVRAAGPEVAWQIEFAVSFTPQQTQQPGWSDNTRAMLGALETRLQTHNSQLQTQRQVESNQATTYNLHVDGRGTVTQLKQVLFDDLTPVGGMLGGPAALSLTGAVKSGDALSVTLQTNPSTGYTWAIDSTDATVLRQAGDFGFRATSNLMGAPMTQVIPLQAVKDGAATLNLVYRRPWQSSAQPTRRVALQAATLSVLADLADPNPPSMKSRLQASALPTKPIVSGTDALPTSFDWRTSFSAKLPAVRDQGYCGSCWAFATTGLFELAVMIKNNTSAPDYSEQYLVSCNTDGWDCDGGWWAHDYHISETVPNDSIAGAVNETAFPYMDYYTVHGTSASCNAPYTHVNRLASWAYIAGEYSTPTADQIKAAIYNYGPIGVGICVASSFDYYDGGVFTTDEASYCGSLTIDHAVILTGWNDNDNGTATWIMRNSWGSYWGENGYMRIKRGISNVGYGATYVIFNGSSTPTPSTNYFPAIATGN